MFLSSLIPKAVIFIISRATVQASVQNRIFAPPEGISLCYPANEPDHDQSVTGRLFPLIRAGARMKRTWYNPDTNDGIERATG